VPLGQVARVTQAVGPARIDHLRRQRVITVEANTDGRPLSDVVRDIMQRVPKAVTFPPGYSLRQGGETEDQTKIFTQMLVAIGVAVMLMYFVLVVQFGSFLEPFAILLSLPLSLIGVMLALLVTGETLNIMSMIGVVLLMGIVAKNAILLIDFAKWSEEAGMERREALIQAGRVRLLHAERSPQLVGAGKLDSRASGLAMGPLRMNAGKRARAPCATKSAFLRKSSSAETPKISLIGSTTRSEAYQKGGGGLVRIS
jgi:HAE1 family hydrophobic/amphiphilic exporter-1